ncbi:alkaline ceramidase [Diplodia corticola]|uniref:Alkaline ceramidase n=1 Tax=Diplodia corticola TaxID=236234 RepID=A0A1J9S1E9_9PEZI|nr:alkaline ceramidase [Diplodia corticola]OJD38771.1 alkaline ceramidase [Diplodia corticola]
MPDWLPSVPYPGPQDGFWSPVTSTLNWCEEASTHPPKSSPQPPCCSPELQKMQLCNPPIVLAKRPQLREWHPPAVAMRCAPSTHPAPAEIINTLTNLLFIYLAFKGINNCLRNEHDGIFLVTFVGYLVVGTGSFLFHSTLKYPMQLVDELSMIYTTCLMFYATFSYGRSRAYAQALGLFLVALAAFITGYYHYLQDPAFHQNMYALLTAVVLFRSIYIMEVRLRPTLKAEEKAAASAAAVANGNDAAAAVPGEKQRRDARDTEILRTMWLMIGTGLSVFLGGFAIWTLDNELCGTLRRWRRDVGLPWGILLEGHGWWHLMTGVGAYFYITWGVWLRHCLNGKQDEYKLHWPNVFQMPLVVKTNKPYQLNGDAKGVKKHL